MHRARITWSEEQFRLGLPSVSETIDPAWFVSDEPRKHDGWSLVCRFTPSPSEQGNPSLAEVHFRMDDAPHSRLQPGTELQLFERGSGTFARVEILDGEER